MGRPVRLTTMAAILCAAGFADVVDRIAVVVGNDVVTESEILEEIRITAFLNGKRVDFSTAQRRAAAERLVDQQLIRDEMQIGNYSEPSEADVDSTLAMFRKQHFGGNEGLLRSTLQTYGLTEAELRKHLAWQIAAVRFATSRFQPGIPVAPQPAPGTQAKPAPQRATVEELLDAWLKEKRKNTTIRFFKEAFDESKD